ncbi:hypothetical protein [Nonomuraea sp. NPDC023979]|uniref:hypothetical protein n=1 Tax=Nonomuraea sp. NPDC023979 TaxID=3154796 RepID=UPI0033CB129B
MTHAAKPRKQPDESSSDYKRRTADWNVTTGAATVEKAARSLISASIRTLGSTETSPERWGAHPVPTAQRDRADSWRRALVDALAILDALHVDEWKREVIAATEQRERA